MNQNEPISNVIAIANANNESDSSQTLPSTCLQNQQHAQQGASTSTTATVTDCSNSSQSQNQILDEDELWLCEQRIPSEVRLKYNSDRWNYTHPLINVLFVFQDAKLGAHEFILLDAPVYDFFRKRLLNKTGPSGAKSLRLTFIDIPSNITLEGVEACLSFIYGKKINELYVDEENFDKFIDAAVYFSMDIHLLPLLLNIQCGPKLELFISSNFARLSKEPEFWKIDNRVILELCQQIQPPVLEEAFFDFICEDKRIGKPFLDKFEQFRKLIKEGYVKLGYSAESTSNTHSRRETSSPTCSQYENERSPSPRPSFKSLPPRVRRKRRLSLESSDNDDNSKSTRNNIIKPALRNLSSVSTIATSRKRCQSNVSNSSGESNKATLEVLGGSETLAQSKKRRRPIIAKKKPKNYSIDTFFRKEVGLLKKYLARGTYNEKVKRTWKSLWNVMNTRKLLENKNNCERFLTHEGITLLLDISETFPDKIELRQVSIEILAILARLQKLRHKLHTKEVVEYLLRELKNYKKSRISTTAGEVLSHFLATYGDNWNIKHPSRDTVSRTLRRAIAHWKLDTDRHVNYYRHEFNDLIYLIKGNDRTANLYALWTFTYFTSRETTDEKRLKSAIVYRDWLREAQITDILKTLADYDEEADKYIPYFAKKLTENLEIDEDDCLIVEKK